MAKFGLWQAKDKAATPQPFSPALMTAKDHRDADRATASWASRSRLLEAYENSGQGWFWATDDGGSLTYLSTNIVSLLQANEGPVLGTPFAELLLTPEEHAREGHSMQFLLTRQRKFEKLIMQAGVTAEQRCWSVSGYPQFSPDGTFAGFLGTAVDVTEQRLLSERASELAMYDPLTKLPNRLRLNRLLETRLLTYAHQGRSCTTMLIDLDRFKQVNDTLGHPAGDALLKQVAQRLRRLIGDDDKVFRLGGDEFVVVLPDADDRGVVGTLADDIIASLTQPYAVEGSQCLIGASIGVAISPYDGDSGDELMRNADLALYSAKGSGRGRFRFFAKEMLQSAEDKRLLESDLRTALMAGELHLTYQPIVEAQTNMMIGVEALVRWHHATRGSVSPGLFIPVAEDAGLIILLGEWALRQACADAASWPGNLKVAVNLSPLQFADASLPATVLSALAASGLAPGRLELEITEGVFLVNSAQTDAMFASLKEIGVRLALDDFGTGYSSLGYLKSAPFNKIKIDQSFVREATLPTSRNSAIIAAIVALASALKMETTAEGVESMDQLELVRDLGVSQIQGYLYSPAVRHEDIVKLIETGALIIEPSGPARQRSPRKSMYRTAGAIHANYYHSILIRNLSTSGALIEGLPDLPLGSLLIVDFGEGQLVFARIRRSTKRQHGIRFEQPLVQDGVGGFCTRHRVSPYALAQAGLPQTLPDDAEPVMLKGEPSSLAGLSKDLELGAGFVTDAATPEEATDASAVQPSPFTGSAGSGEPPWLAEQSIPEATNVDQRQATVNQLAGRYLGQLRGNRKRHAVVESYLRDHILPDFGRHQPDQLLPSQVASWLQVKASAGCSPVVCNRLQIIMSQLVFLAMQGRNLCDPRGKLEGIGVFDWRDDDERVLSSEEIQRLDAATAVSKNLQLKAVVALLRLTGLRTRDLLNARWEDLEVSTGVLTLRREQGARRSVALSHEACAIIGELQRWDECPFIITNPRTRKPYRSFSGSWHAVRMRAALPDLELDDLRDIGAEKPVDTGVMARKIEHFSERGRAATAV